MGEEKTPIQSSQETDEDIAVDEYLRICTKYGVDMDPSVVIVLKSKVQILKPSYQYQEKELLTLGELLLSTKPEVAKAVDCIKTLDFTHCKIGSNGAIWLNRVLQDNRSIKSLNLTSSQVGPRGAESLANLLVKNQSLTNLNLRGNKLYLKGGLRIAEALRHNTVLSQLDLSDNHIGFFGITKLENELRDHTTIKHFNLDDNFVLEEILNSATHGVGALLTVLGSFVLMARVSESSIYHKISCGIFCFSLIVLYVSSALYHGFFKFRRIKDILARLDHGAIYILIAGTYTPFLMISLHHEGGFALLGFIWILGISGLIIETAFRNTLPTWLSVGLYVFMGWVVLFAMGPLFRNVPIAGIYYLAAGGLAYTGGVYFFITGFKKPINHAIWHIFVFFGSFLHYLSIFIYVAPTELKV